jgi:hypothetical protein
MSHAFAKTIVFLMLSFPVGFALAQEHGGEGDLREWAQEEPLLSDEPAESFPVDFVLIHKSIDEELKRKTGKGLVDVPYSVRWLKKEAQVVYRNPKTGKTERMTLQRNVDSCC